MRRTDSIDRNGTMIYVGDIIRYKRTRDVKEYIEEVKQEGELNFRPFNVHDIDLKTVEVIGNIYENRELLNH